MHTDNSHKVMLIAHFVSSAKKTLGHIHGTNLLTDQAYATEHMLRAIFSNDQTLIEQANNLSIELNLNINLIRGMDQYLQACKGNRPDFDYLKTQDFLIELSRFIYSINADGDQYRVAADAFLNSLHVDDVPFALNLIRELYFFWNIEENPPTVEKIDTVFNNLFKAQPSNNFLVERWHDVDNVKLSDVEHDKLQRYVEALVGSALSYDAVRTRKKFAKIVVLELRNQVDKTEKSYRAVVKKVKSAIQKNDLKGFFIQVSREFYHFWVGEVDAETHIKLD
jgi:hypothetical protein